MDQHVFFNCQTLLITGTKLKCCSENLFIMSCGSFWLIIIASLNDVVLIYNFFMDFANAKGNLFRIEPIFRYYFIAATSILKTITENALIH